MVQDQDILRRIMETEEDGRTLVALTGEAAAAQKKEARREVEKYKTLLSEKLQARQASLEAELADRLQEERTVIEARAEEEIEALKKTSPALLPEAIDLIRGEIFGGH